MTRKPTGTLTPASRERISVDLRGWRAALFEQARARGVSPSDVVREALSLNLSQSFAQKSLPITAQNGRDDAGARCERVRLSLRMTRVDARATLAAARVAGLPAGAYVAGLVAGVPILQHGGARRDHLAALTASSAELATLSRDLRDLTCLLRQGASHAAQAYRAMLDDVERDVHAHLRLAAAALAELQPKRRLPSDRPRQAD